MGGPTEVRGGRSSPKNALDLIRRGYAVRRREILVSGRHRVNSCNHSRRFSLWSCSGALVYAERDRARPHSVRKARKASQIATQQWLVPSPDPDTAAHAVLFRPPGEGPFRLAVIAHASTQNVLRRAQMPQPEYRALAAWLVARGFAVLVPERPGHGATGGKYLEDQRGCDEADYSHAGPRHRRGDLGGAELSAQPALHPAVTARSFVGHSAGGWGALALAADRPGGGRGHHRHSPPAAAATPTTSPIRSARRTR